MCTAVYIAADIPLTLVPWVETAPAFYVAEISGSDLAARVQFSQPHVYYAGSYEGCGFQRRKYPAESCEPEELERGRRSLRDFADYLTAELGRTGRIGLYACWEGEQDAPPAFHRTITPSALRDPAFFFHDKERSTVVADAG